MTVRIGDIVVDRQNARLAADSWCAALGYRITETDDTGVAVAGDSSAPTLLLLESSDRKVTKNRIHFDVCPVEGSTRSAEIARLESLGVTLVDVGQTGDSWTVMADPDGNEFCVMNTVLPPEPGTVPPPLSARRDVLATRASGGGVSVLLCEGHFARGMTADDVDQFWSHRPHWEP